MQSIESWGRTPKTTQEVHPLHWSSDPIPSSSTGSCLPYLPYGLGRSYGDVCLNDGAIALPTPAMGRLLAFDPGTGVIRCEAGATLDALLQFAVPRGWFLPTTPGTKFVTVGGAIANDIHGKNHHQVGTFGCQVRRFELLRSNGERRLCTPAENADWYAATIGGLGLTGVITWAEVALRPIASAMIEMESIKFRNLNEFFELSAASDHDFEHTVSWIDCIASGESLGRGIFMRGNHAVEPGPLQTHRPPKLAVPFDLPALTLNRHTVRAFNALYYGRLRSGVTRSRVHYEPFFYPLDGVNRWNRIYGKRGFYQYQFVVPFQDGEAVIREILTLIARSGLGSFLAVLKTFGTMKSPGWMSFPMPGITLALDFANTPAVLPLFAELDRVVFSAGGRLYPAKDGAMRAVDFQKSYPRWEALETYRDPSFSSSFWRRVTQKP